MEIRKKCEYETNDRGASMKVLFLCDKHSYVTKMSRVRFHSVEAIDKACDLTWSGENWNNYNNDLTVQENIDILYADKEKPDVVMAYKPLELNGFSEIKQTKCIRYNEMYDVEWTKQEINESGADIVLCHHLNDMKQYQEIYKDSNIKFINVPHSAEKTVFKDYGMKKQIDLLLVGSIYYESLLGNHYPLRARMAAVLTKMTDKYKCGIYPHPGGTHYDAYTNKYAIEFAKAINSAKICITCRGAPKSRFGKYIEIPMCATAIAADMPGEHQEEFSKFLIEIDMSMSDSEIIDKLSFYLENDKERDKKVLEGIRYAYQHTQEEYAKRFIDGVA